MKFKFSPLMAALTIVASAAFVPTAAQAQVSFNIGAVSLYKASGNDQDDKQGNASTAKNFRPAIQGGVDYSFGNGLYVGNWNSTGNFGGGNAEIDLYAGYGGEIAKGISYDLSVATYIYPGADDGWNGSEMAAKVTYNIASLKYVHGLGDYKGSNKWVVGVKMPVTDKISLSADYHIRNNSGAKSFVLGGSYDLGSGLTTNATISGSDNNSTAGKTRLVLGVTKSF